MNPSEARIVEAALQAGADRPGALLPILHAIQDRAGYIPPAALPVIGRRLNLSRAEVHGVVSFYHHFRSVAPGRHVVRICVAESCQAMGAADLSAHAQRTLGIGFHATSADGRFTLEPVYCLGNCACSPAMLVDGELQGRVDAPRFDAIVADLGHAT